MTFDPKAPIVDPSRTACLCHDGAPGIHVAMCVEPDGSTSLWLEALLRDGQPGGCARSCCAPHEQDKPWRPPCIAITRSGTPCRNAARHEGLCTQHEDWPPEQCQTPPPIHDGRQPHEHSA